MKVSTPIIICDENEVIRQLLKEMLTKHGYFHLLEAHSPEEILPLITPQRFLLIHKHLLSALVKEQISRAKSYLIIAQNDAEETVGLSAIFGAKHLLSFPYSSKSLVEKINSLLS